MNVVRRASVGVGAVLVKVSNEGKVVKSPQITSKHLF